MKYSLYISLFLVFVFGMSSCANTDSDTTPPVIGNIFINPNDTINIGPGDTLRVNVGDDESADILILGHRLLFRAEFSDDEKLSSYFIHLDSVKESISQTPVKDTVFYIKRAWTDIYGMKQYSFEDEANGEIYVPDVLKYTAKDPTTGDNVTLNLPLREGFCDLNVSLLDVAGNQVNKTKRIIMLSRETVIKLKRGN